MTSLTRRVLLRRAAVASGALALGPAFWQRAAAAAATPGDGPYGPLGPPDANGIRLPAGFRARLIARGNEVVPGTAYRFPVQADGQATFAAPDGGWILVTNSEFVPPDGGVSAIRFAADGRVVDAYRILGATAMNCAGGPTPWGTWLSCEEHDAGLVWECDPTQPSQGVRRPALGTFNHEAVAVDPVGQRLYLTEDDAQGNFYRFTPESYPELDVGVLEAAVVGPGGRVTWVPVPEPNPTPLGTPTRRQVPEATVFRRAEGIWFDSGMVYVATTADHRIHAYDTVAERIEVVYDRDAMAEPAITDPDNITVSPAGDLYICENSDASDGGLDIGLLTPDLTISRFLRAEGPKHVYANPAVGPSELCGAVFDPSGTRLYFTSQRARTVSAGTEPGPGEVYEVTGPFRLARPRSGPLSPGNPRSGAGRDRGGLVGPALGVEVPRRVSWATVRRRGIPVALTLDGPARVEVVVRGRFTAAAHRGTGGRRRRRYRLERVAASYRRGGPKLVRVRFGRRSARLLTGRRYAVRLTVVVTVGGERVVRQTVLAPQRGRRSRRRRRAGR